MVRTTMVTPEVSQELAEDVHRCLTGVIQESGITSSNVTIDPANNTPETIARGELNVTCSTYEFAPRVVVGPNGIEGPIMWNIMNGEHK